MTKTGSLRPLLSVLARPKVSSDRYRTLRLVVGAALLAITTASICILLHLLVQHSTSQFTGSGPFGSSNHRHKTHSLDLSSIPQVLLESDAEPASARNPNCSYWDCFNVYKCGHGNTERMSIYVYPLQTFSDARTLVGATTLSKEFYLILGAIVDSDYYTADPEEACVFVPSLDLLNQNRVNVDLAAKALATLEYWDKGQNHLLFNMVPGVKPDFNTSLDVQTDLAMVVGSGFDSWSYRPGFDLSIPFYNPMLHETKLWMDNDERPYLLISAQLNLYARHNRILQELAYDHTDVLVLQPCVKDATDSVTSKTGAEDEATSSDTKRVVDLRCSFPNQQQMVYPKILGRGVFCLVARGMRLVQLNLLEVMGSGCIPVIMADNVVMPFNEIIDWSLAAITIRETNLHAVVTVLQAISRDHIAELRRHGAWLYAQYFSSLPRIVHTLLDELNDRIFPHLARDYRHWNIPVTRFSTQNPLFLQLTAPKSPGFTAVILTYDRVESLFTLIEKLSVVPSLHMILVIWNNQKKAPPHLSMFPKIAKPLNVIRTKANKLSNRFYPYADIETEAILTIDDDIVMLTADELDFGYEVWREFPDRIVGFPSRTHVWDNATGRWRYESEWTNEISMVLTGAAFHHKYWSHMYTNAMPGGIKDWVDEHMNCEDIAMNFLVANMTGKPPIKVAPRKKFKCPECTNTEMLSADLNHMVERSECINRFTDIYGRMPLRTVEFRADPVLYKDNFPEKLKRFNDIGSL